MFIKINIFIIFIIIIILNIWVSDESYNCPKGYYKIRPFPLNHQYFRILYIYIYLAMAGSSIIVYGNIITPINYFNVEKEGKKKELFISNQLVLYKKPVY